MRTTIITRRMKLMDLSFLSALLLLSALALIFYNIRTRYAESSRWTEHSYEVLISVEGLHHALLEAESSGRGYMLTGNQQQKRLYLLHAKRVKEQLQQVRSLTADNPRQQQRLAELSELIDHKLATLGNSVAALGYDGYRAERQSEMVEEGTLIMSDIRVRLQEMMGQEKALLSERKSLAQQTMEVLMIAVWAGGAASILILSLSFLVARREARNHERATVALEAANKDILNLSQMTQLLQSCGTLTESRDILASYGAKLFPGDSGGIYLLNSSRTLMIDVADWGAAGCEAFSPNECWALRLGQTHLTPEGSGIKCQHLADAPGSHICIPLSAHHETLGVLHLGTGSASESSLEHKHATAVAFAEQVALALGNLQLREQLRELSIRDPLTGLLNRRHMEESLSREISRAGRTGLPLSVIMLDVDHFKNFNDSFGHEAGDHVLREVGYLLQKSVRGSDVACRFGGEEFTVILPDASSEAACETANRIREAVKGLHLTLGKVSLGRVTISAGVATYPLDGDTLRSLLSAADASLYLAKQKGRDRVEACG